MRFVSKLLLFSAVFLCSACAGINYKSFYEGITCFKSQNYRAAFIRLKPEAMKGQPDAQYAIGFMYYYGQGVVENRRKAWYWISRAARAGQPDAIEAAAILSKKRTHRGTVRERII